MSLVSIYRSWVKGASRKQKRQGREHCRLRLETLEERRLLSNNLHFDFGSSSSPLASGYTRVPVTAYTSSQTFGWADTTGITSKDRGSITWGDPMKRDFHYGVDGTFLVDVPSGTYTVKVTLGDYQGLHDNVDAYLQGQRVASNVTTQTGQFFQRSYQVQVTNGQLALHLHDNGGKDPNFALNGLDITPGVLPALYVSTQGNDANSGISSSSPLRNIATALKVVSPGTTVNVAGGVYYEQVSPIIAGTSSQWITLTSYNGMAVIDGSTQTWTAGSNQNQGMVELRQPYYRFQNITVANSKNSGVILGADNLTVTGCTVDATQRHGISTDTLFQTAAPGNGTMIHNITITNNTVYNAVLKGEGNGQAISLIADGFTVSGNTVRNNSVEGIDIWLGSTHGEVAGNTLYGNNNAYGLYVDGASYLRIDGNLVYGNDAGICVSSENVNYSTHDIWVYNNVAHDNANAGIAIWDSTSSPGHHGSQNVIIANNTLINNKTGIYLAGDGNTAQIINNLSYTLGGNQYSQLYDASTNSTYSTQNNVWLTSLTGFVSVSDNDYHLTSSSPAINAGLPLPLLTDDLGNVFTIATDFDGAPRVVNGLPDAGAFEY